MCLGANFVEHCLVEGWSTNNCVSSSAHALFAGGKLPLPRILGKMSAVQCFLARVASQPLVPQLALHAVRMVLAPHVLSEGRFPAGLATFDALQLRHFFCTAHVLALPEEKRHESRKYVSRTQTVTTFNSEDRDAANERAPITEMT